MAKEIEKNKLKDNLEFNIVIMEDVGYIRQVAEFTATRWVDEDKTPFLKNEKVDFLELYPQDIKDIKNYKIEDLNKNILNIEDQLKNIRNKPIEEYLESDPNTEDLEYNLKKLYAKKRYCELEKDKRVSYMSVNIKGSPTFHYLRNGNSFFPMKWNAETKLIHTASEPVVKKAGILLRNKKTKYSNKSIVEITTIVLLIIGVILTLGNTVGGVFLWKSYSNSEIAQAKLESLHVANVCGEIVSNSAITLQKLNKEFNFTQAPIITSMPTNINLND